MRSVMIPWGLAAIAIAGLWLRGRWVGDAAWFTTQRWEGRELRRRQVGVSTGAGQIVITLDVMKTRFWDDWVAGEWKKL